MAPPVDMLSSKMGTGSQQEAHPLEEGSRSPSTIITQPARPAAHGARWYLEPPQPGCVLSGAPRGWCLRTGQHRPHSHHGGLQSLRRVLPLASNKEKLPGRRASSRLRRGQDHPWTAGWATVTHAWRHVRPPHPEDGQCPLGGMNFTS